MKKIILILLTLAISSCGFHTPYKSNASNFFITGDDEFKSIIRQSLDNKLPKNLTLKLIKVSKTKNNDNYTEGRVVNYNLNVAIDFEVYKDEKLIFANKIFRSKYLKNFNNSSNDHQEEFTYNYLQKHLAKKIIRKLSKL